MLRISKLEDRSFDSSSESSKKEKGGTKTKESLHGLWDIISGNNPCIIDITEEEGRKKQNAYLKKEWLRVLLKY